jgi:hypothetical protein
MSTSVQHSLHSAQLADIAQGQVRLNDALDQALRSLRHPGFDSLTRHLVEVSVVLRRHKHLVLQAAHGMPSDTLAQQYLEFMNTLRRDINLRMTLHATGAQKSSLMDEFETLCWQTLSAGVLWLDGLHQNSPSQHQPSSQAGMHWARARGQVDQDRAALQLQKELQELEDFDIDQILYCSLATKLMREDELDALTQSAERLNRIDHITGMLMYGDGVFVQLIEGPRDAINDLWERILKDKRHYGVVQLYHRREVEARVCDGWGMHYVERQHLQAIVREVKEEIVQGRKTAWAPAIERIDFLLSQTDWSYMFSQVSSQAQNQVHYPPK